ncbi:MAG: PCRF domain-containing protein, partial [Corynebacterium sp.]|nr:PCRF domain-containing protein [Corynebacterium sp.]
MSDFAGSPSKVDDILSEYQGLEMQLADPELHNDAAAARRVAKRFSELQPVIQTYNKLVETRDDLEAAREMASEDPDFAAEADRLAADLPGLEEKLTDLLAPRDPHDSEDVVMEIKS